MDAFQSSEVMKKKAKVLVGMMDYINGGGEDFNPGYSQDHVDKCSNILDEFIESLNRLGEKPDEPRILDYVKWVVLQLNKLNENIGGGLIETGQREDLYEYIDYAVRCHGLDPKGDVTEEWREW
jgi:hypothetical protein